MPANLMNEKSERTKAKIIDAALRITMSEGFDKATFVHIAETAGISKSGINAHFKRKSDIAAKLAPIYIQMIKGPLNFNSTAAFYDSWVNSFNTNAQFRAAILSVGPIIPKLDGVKGLFDAINGQPEDVRRCVYMCIGFSVLNS
ncbi:MULTISPECIES: TetR/AcrR family transcriptional regulator [unclassified Agarivorans]|uniref:TetR/AcrR family transcriptional regulator n=1 Tax=unclassified Agarivorans TaxID=2636026 RepID=UPI0026E2451E|nr:MULTISPECIES: TetR/AcrR family transcriptional regulator [unclassified Agarivorans]MDO6686057.1 TetR/AcrR family transcriptional regulator [Agarivorans sp. 3_MG-2023]MDO6713805.1 TetR/AcrR family transcriptional regulator [Agarivorans sp. 2_MG-2023]